MSETNYESSYSQNSNDLITSTENYSEKSFEKMSEEEKTIKYCRCILCGRIPLIYYKNDLVYVKCIYCEKVSTKIYIGNYIYIHLKNLSSIFSDKNIDNHTLKEGNIIKINNEDKHLLPFSLIDNYCEIHFEKYYSFCETCKKNLCYNCENEHEGHIINSYNYYTQYLDSNELKKIEKTISNNLEYFNSFQNIKENMFEGLKKTIKTMFYFIQENNVSYLSKKLILDLIDNIPIIHDYGNFPLEFNNFLLKSLRLIKENIDNKLDEKEDISELIMSFQKKIIETFQSFEKTIEEIKFDRYYFISTHLYNFAENILQIYKVKKNKLNYQIIMNLVNLKKHLININEEKILLDEFEEYQNMMKIKSECNYMIKNYIGIEKEFSKQLIDINLTSYRLIGNLDNTAIEYNTTVRELIIINWIINPNKFNDPVYIYNRD